MFQTFFTTLRDAKVPVSLKEYLTLLEALEKDAINRNIEEFYYLSRAILVKGHLLPGGTVRQTAWL